MNGNHYNEFIGKKYILFSVIAALVFWAVFTRILLPFVPTQHPTWSYFWAGFTACPLTGTFFFAMHMFRIVLAENLKAKRQA